MKSKEEIVGYLRSVGVSGKTAKCIERIMGQFATVDAFFTASRNDITRVYLKITSSKHSIGQKFWKVFDKALAYYKGIAEPEARPAQAEARAEKAMEEAYAESLKMMTRNEIKDVLAFMELCDVEEINLLEVVGFLRSVKTRQRKKPQEDVQAPQGNAEPAK